MLIQSVILIILTVFSIIKYKCDELNNRKIWVNYVLFSDIIKIWRCQSLTLVREINFFCATVKMPITYSRHT